LCEFSAGDFNGDYIAILLRFADGYGISYLTAATDRLQYCQRKFEYRCCLHTLICYVNTQYLGFFGGGHFTHNADPRYWI